MEKTLILTDFEESAKYIREKTDLEFSNGVIADLKGSKRKKTAIKNLNDIVFEVNKIQSHPVAFSHVLKADYMFREKSYKSKLYLENYETQKQTQGLLINTFRGLVIVCEKSITKIKDGVVIERKITPLNSIDMEGLAEIFEITRDELDDVFVKKIESLLKK